MKIRFNMPVELPKEGANVSYSVKTEWRLSDGQNFLEILTLKVTLFGKQYTLEKVQPIYKAILDANSEIFEASLNMPAEMEPYFEMIFRKHGDSAEQDMEDYNVDHYPPLDPIEWLQEKTGGK